MQTQEMGIRMKMKVEIERLNGKAGLTNRAFVEYASATIENRYNLNRSWSYSAPKMAGAIQSSWFDIQSTMRGMNK